jgi:hypothetical protein
MIKKYLLAGSLIVFGAAAFAQESHIYFKGGVNVANVSINDNGSYSDANSLVSFHAGIAADLPLAKCISVQPSLLFTGKGAKTASGQTTGTNPSYFTQKFNPYYVELPVNVVGKIPLAASESNFFIGAGPYIAMGVAGKNKTEGKIFGTAFEHDGKIKFSDDDPTTTNYEENAGFSSVKRFDYGLNGTAGFEFSSIVISANYGYGLAKIAGGTNNNNTNDNNKHRVWSLSLGVRL